MAECGFCKRVFSFRDEGDEIVLCGKCFPMTERQHAVFDAAMALEQEQSKHGTDAFSQERFDQLATALIHACRRAKEGR